MAQGDRLVYRANISRRRTVEHFAENEPRTERRRRYSPNRREGSPLFVIETREPIREKEKPPVPRKKPELIKHPYVVNLASPEKAKPVTVSGFFGGGKDLTVGRTNSSTKQRSIWSGGPCYLERRKTRHAKGRRVSMPPDSDTGSDRT